MNTIEIKKTIKELELVKELYDERVLELNQRLNSLLTPKKVKLNELIDDLYLSVRAYNVVMNVGSSYYKLGNNFEYRKLTLKHLINIPESLFLQSRNCGYKTLSEIKKVLKEKGLTLKK
jgi:DNA-directed RNA polymerase alpha subunit